MHQWTFPIFGQDVCSPRSAQATIGKCRGIYVLDQFHSSKLYKTKDLKGKHRLLRSASPYWDRRRMDKGRSAPGSLVQFGGLFNVLADYISNK